MKKKIFMMKLVVSAVENEQSKLNLKKIRSKDRVVFASESMSHETVLYLFKQPFTAVTCQVTSDTHCTRTLTSNCYTDVMRKQ